MMEKRKNGETIERRNDIKMSRIDSFEDLEMWKESMRLCVGLYGAVKECKDYGFKDQIQRASMSVPSNIAEGFERQSNKEF
ncbi:MAG: four helix bundle protein, partial [Bacteroidales bacterium]|nr:four helix bundle protein [Bacteroidales bacterium]